MLALQNLLHEIAVSEGNPPPLPLPSSGGYNLVTSNNHPRHHQQPRGGSAVFNSLLNNLSGSSHAPPSGIHASGDSVSSSTLAGLAVPSKSSTAVARDKHRMTSTEFSALTNTPATAAGVGAGQNSSYHIATPKSGGGRVSYADGLPHPSSSSQYPLQAVHPPINRQNSAASRSDGKDLVSNVGNIHVNVHQNTPSYFSPMMHGMNNNNVPDSARLSSSDHKQAPSGASEYKEYKREYKEGGIAATTPSAGRSAAGSVVSRGAWNADPESGKRSNAYGNGKKFPQDYSLLVCFVNFFRVHK